MVGMGDSPSFTVCIRGSYDPDTGEYYAGDCPDSGEGEYGGPNQDLTRLQLESKWKAQAGSLLAWLVSPATTEARSGSNIGLFTSPIPGTVHIPVVPDKYASLMRWLLIGGLVVGGVYVVHKL